MPLQQMRSLASANTGGAPTQGVDNACGAPLSFACVPSSGVILFCGKRSGPCSAPGQQDAGKEIDVRIVLIYHGVNTKVNRIEVGREQAEGLQ